MSNGWTGGQYSVFRTLFGVYLLAHFVHLLPWSAEVFSSAGMLSQGGDSPLMLVFPNLLALWDTPAAVGALVISGAGASVFFTIGYRDRWAALWIWYVLACLFGRNPLIANPSLPYVGWMLIAHFFVPSAPYGSLEARGRVDPAGGWVMPKAVFLSGWIVLALSYSYSGYTKLLSPSWVAGDTVAYVLQNPLARDWFLREMLLALPPFVLSGLTLGILWIELLFVLFALSRRLRPWAWAGMLAVQLGFALLLNFADLTLAMLLFHFFTFDPAWISAKQPSLPEAVFYDGNCGLCHRVVRFLLAEDVKGAFRFAPLQSEAFSLALSEKLRADLPDSFVVVTAQRTALVRSDAVIHLLQHLGGVWRILGGLLLCVPRFFRDSAYDLIGRRRHRMFARPDATCPLIPPALRGRFLPAA